MTLKGFTSRFLYQVYINNVGIPVIHLGLIYTLRLNIDQIKQGPILYSVWREWSCKNPYWAYRIVKRFQSYKNLQVVLLKKEERRHRRHIRHFLLFFTFRAHLLMSLSTTCCENLKSRVDMILRTLPYISLGQ